MVERFNSADTYYSHGYIVPLVSGYFSWAERNEWKVNENGSHWGLWLVAGGLLLHIASMAFYVFFPSGFSLVIVVTGLIAYLYGRDAVRFNAFPIAYLLFMIPLPIKVLNLVGVPLKLLVGEVSSSALYLLGIPLLRRGYSIDTPRGSLLIDNPCSGLRSLIAFLAIGAVMAHLTPATFRRKAALLMLAIPVAISMNIARVGLLIWVTSRNGPEAAMPGTWIHDGSGYAVFLCGFFLLAGLSRVLRHE